MDDERDEIEQAVAGELSLHRPEVRASREGAGALLDPEFVEVGKSGRRWDRERMLADLPSMSSGEPGEEIEVRDMRGVRLAPGLVHLTYTTVVGGRRALRSALWRRDAEGRWRTYYHQGTPAAD
ncbi:nuclear transport factor 2 family protein [Nocardiopsis ganjiahuensis]|uniref:nuclear transport factor 2 family protein n=1 Tax=Nocardiopsis ganjiahuensis TaxID=239984 RepID=UPI000345EB29|nr:DUF4440 domain-containing protein [Nocardiopsis ganjiahuensis]